MLNDRFPRAARHFAILATFALVATFVRAQIANGTAAPADNATPPAPNSQNGNQTAVPANTATPSGSNSQNGNQTVVLSPFEVQSSQDTGYRARNTLAGSRISTPLDDLATPITVVTKDFMDDIGAANINDILTYEAGAESTSDYKLNVGQLGRTSDNAAEDPNGSTRGRGLAPFDITRDYFFSLTLGNPVFSTQGIGQSIGFDTYNLDSVTIVRGPDSVLAGLGSPAGIINYTPQVAELQRNFSELSYRYGSFGDQRATFNTNQSIGDKFAIRVAGLWADREFEQQPSYSHDKRYYAALTWQPFATTTLRASYENAHVQERLPNTFTPEDDISQWIQLGKPTSPALGSNPTGLLSGPRNSGANLYLNSNGSIFAAYNNTGMYSYAQKNLSGVPSAFWQPLRMSNDTYGDWHKINTNMGIQDLLLTSEQVSLDQQILPGLTLNLAGLHEIGNDHQLNDTRPDFVQLSVDPNQTLPNGTPNPHFGETYMYISGLDSINQLYSTNLVGRASLNYDLNLKKYNRWFGRYVFTGFTEYRKTDGDFNDYDMNTAGTASNTGGGPGIYTYTGGTAANGYVMRSAPNPAFLVSDAPFIGTSGGPTNTYTTVDNLKEEYKAETRLSTTAFVVQPYLLDDMVVGLFGLRRDVDRQGYLTTNGIDPNGNLVDPLPHDQYSSGPLQTQQAQTKTYGVVVHGPKLGSLDLHWLSVGYNNSQNFQPNAGTIDLTGNQVSNPTGTTKDWSVAADLLDSKLNVRADWFSTLAAGSPDASVNFPLVQWTMPFEILGSYADLAQQAGVKNYQTGMGSSVTTGDPALANAYGADTKSSGMEVELTYNVTKNWRVFGTVTREQAVQSNIAPQLTSFIANRVAYWQSLGIMNGPFKTTKDWGGASSPETGEQVYENDILGGEIQYLAANGQPSQQLHHWKESLVTNYTFDKGVLNRLGVGTGVRWLDKTIIGNPPIMGTVNGARSVIGLDLQHPYTTPPEAAVEMWLTYTLPKIDNKYVVSLRLEGDNLTSKSGYQAVGANIDGTHAIFAIDPPPAYYFTMDFKF